MISDRQGRRSPEDVNSWTKAHRTWIRQQKFEHEAQQRVLADCLEVPTPP